MLRSDPASFESDTERRSDEPEAPDDLLEGDNIPDLVVTPAGAYHHPEGATKILHCQTTSLSGPEQLHFIQYLKGAKLHSVMLKVTSEATEGHPDGLVQRLDFTQSQLNWLIRVSNIAGERLVNRMLGEEFLAGYGIVSGGNSYNDDEEDDD